MRVSILLAGAALAVLVVAPAPGAEAPHLLSLAPDEGPVVAEVEGDAQTADLWSRAVSATTVHFATTPVGSSSLKECYQICWPPNCTGSGVITQDEALAPPFSVVNLRRHTGPIASYADCTGTPVSFPVSLGSGQQLVLDFRFAPTYAGSFADTFIASTLVYNLTGTATGGGSGCTPSDTTLCIDGRFRIQVSYSTVQGGGLAGFGHAVALSSLGVTKGGLFWFFGSDNPELLIKVLDGCGVNGKRWIYFSAGTNVGFTVTVTDTQTGAVRSYSNPDLNPAAPVQDTSALNCS